METFNSSFVQYHIGLSENMVKSADYALLIDEKKSVQPIAQILDKNACYLNENREYFSYLANLKGNYVLIMSTGTGAPPLGIGLEELAMIGIKVFIRLGAITALQNFINIGDIIISNGAIRYENTSKHYAPSNYPAVASLEITNTLEETIKDKNLDYHYGITVSTDTYAAQEINGFLGYTPKKFKNILEEWRNLNVLGVDMEISALFTICNVFGLESAAIMDVVTNKTHANTTETLSDNERIQKWRKFLPDCLKADMQNKGKI